MYLTKHDRRVAAADPSYGQRRLDQERAAAAEHARKLRLPAQLEAACRRLAIERQAVATKRKRDLLRALERVDRLTASARSLGLTLEPETVSP